MIHALSSQYYDAIYAAQGKDYAREADLLHALIQQHKQAPGNTLLDMACGTAAHTYHLQNHYTVTGVDIDSDMLSVARTKCPGLEFLQADMADFDLGRQFDVIICLFGAVGYVQTIERLNQTLASLKHHLYPGGLLVVEPWLYQGQFTPGFVGAVHIDQPNFKLSRFNVSAIAAGLSILDFNYMVATPQGIEYFRERHELGLFSHDDYCHAFQAAGLRVTHDPQGLNGRGLYVGLSTNSAVQPLDYQAI